MAGLGGGGAVRLGSPNSGSEMVIAGQFQDVPQKRHAGLLALMNVYTEKRH